MLNISELMNFLQILLASLITMIKSSILKLKLIVILSTALLLAHKKIDCEKLESESVENKRRLSL